MAIQHGRISTLPDGKIDPVAAERQWKQSTHPGRGKGGRAGVNGDGPDISEGYRQARAVLATYEARLRQLEFEKKSGQLLEADAVKRALFNATRKVRDLLLSVPARIAPVVSKAEPADAYRVVEEEMKRIADEFANEARRIANDG